MRTLILGGTAIAALMAAGSAAAQTRVTAHGPATGHPMSGPGLRPTPQPGIRPMPHGDFQRVHGTSRWGSRIGGRWWGGANAPGGWNAYRRPTRGWVLPSYWIAPRFYVNDWSSYGFAQPPAGYGWSRYYDDAVLIDSRGSVYDSVYGVDWDRYDGGYDDRADSYAEGDVPPPGAPFDRRDNGLGGAAVGAVAGGVAGNLIAGRGNRLGGTLIGAGVGAAAGYAIDKAEDRRGPEWGDRYDEPRGRPVPPPHGYYPQPPVAPYAPPIVHRGPGSWTSPDGSTTVVTTSGGGYYGAGTTTVTVQTAPVVTTTTTEVFEDVVTYRTPRKVIRRAWKPRPRCRCK